MESLRYFFLFGSILDRALASIIQIGINDCQQGRADNRLRLNGVYQSQKINLSPKNSIFLLHNVNLAKGHLQHLERQYPSTRIPNYFSYCSVKSSEAVTMNIFSFTVYWDRPSYNVLLLSHIHTRLAEQV